MRVQADFDLCEANALCVGIAPETFELDDDDYLQIIDEQVWPDNESKIRQAVASCPRNALSIVED
jgi:ferredoxin